MGGKAPLKILEEAAPLSVVWESGAVVAEYVQDESVFPRGSFHGKHVLDLGAGTGITSLTLALLGATVMATDIPESLPLLQRCVVIGLLVFINELNRHDSLR